MVVTTTLLKGCWFDSLFLCGVCILSLCLNGFFFSFLLQYKDVDRWFKMAMSVSVWHFVAMWWTSILYRVYLLTRLKLGQTPVPKPNLNWLKQEQRNRWIYIQCTLAVPNNVNGSSQSSTSLLPLSISFLVCFVFVRTSQSFHAYFHYEIVKIHNPHYWIKSTWGGTAKS